MSKIKVELQEFLGNDRSIANMAWTSSMDFQKKASKTDQDVEKLVNMLADSGHGTPFEAVILRFWFNVSIFLDRQIVTYRIASHSGLSGRYRTMPSSYYDIPEDVIEIANKAGCMDLAAEYKDSCENAYNSYMATLYELKEAEKCDKITNDEFKRAREIIRGQLPVSGMTERVTTMNLRAFANFYKQRSKPDAQKEMQYLAEEMLKQIKEKNICPIAIAALEKNNWII